MNGFEGPPLTIGSINGWREFGMDRTGRLHGISHKVVWRPGENVALCRAIELNVDQLSKFAKNPSKGYLTIEEVDHWSRKEADNFRHMMRTCSCGFYAYYAKPNINLAYSKSVSGVIEGYGQTVMGTDGFRSSKAKILALCIAEPPKIEATPSDEATDAALSAATGGIVGPTTGELVIHQATTTTSTTGTTITGTVLPSSGSPPPGTWVISTTPNATTVRQTIPADLQRSYDLVRHNYKDIPFFTSVSEMLEKFPVEPPPAPTPENDPDFWERPLWS